jgi:large subunit ribosomal protein L18
MHTNRTKLKQEKRERRHRRIRSHLSGSSARPRLSVFKSNRYLSVQLIDDEKGRTIATASTKGITEKKTPLIKAQMLGKTIAALAQKSGVSTVVFDRSGYLYAGRVKAMADGARSGGLVF